MDGTHWDETAGDETAADKAGGSETGESNPAKNADTPVFDLPGTLRRIRRVADLSQRELAQRCGVASSTIAQAETGRRNLTLTILVRAAALAGLRLALVDANGSTMPGMDDQAVRDLVGRRFPAHLDTRYGDDDWWHSEHRRQREQPWYTFDRLRYTRDFYRARSGIPDDHQRPCSGDSPEDRRDARRRAARKQRLEKATQRMLAIPWAERLDDFTCTCPPECAELDDFSGRPVHAENCPCRCDVA